MNLANSAFLATLLLLAALPQAVAQERGRRNPLGNGEEVIAEGRDIYNRACTICHGIDGQAGDRGPALGARRRYLRRTDEEIFHAIDIGIPGTEMPPMGLTEEENWKVVAFIRSLRARAKDVPVHGDKDKGSEIFWGKAQCGQCHTVHGRGGLLGPDLSNLAGETSLQQIREALTVAKPHPPLGYRPVTVVTKDGRRISGVAKNEHNFSIQILGNDNKLHLFVTGELKEIIRGEKSPMPTDYDKRLSESEFQDLVAFLARLVRNPEQDASED